ncbi:hypothetical protein [Oceanicoccus sagamiensis]|uniref:Uncharacterized protein n=1 Tax=Oceanicoccus sagamiensis TaxID=716816 RepID=A0A1X9NKJ7_9GAMM|nr:hypothetical protein [Oceanicoccus sagamiensis]ARN75367.1 hypothetical protein BST96_15360 [Oceanicoccus sagamiensis]
MQISSLPIISQPPAQTQRPDITERVQKDVQRDPTRNDDNDSLEELRARSEEILQQRIESSGASSGVQARQQAQEDGLPLNTQRALQTFAENSPSPEQQLGIELVGVDTFA